MQQNIEKKLLNLAKHPLYPAAAIDIIVSDLLLLLPPRKNFERIVSFEATLLYFLISNNKTIDLSFNNNKELILLEESIRQLLSEFEHSFMAPVIPSNHSTKEEIIKSLQENTLSQPFLAASFLYSGDEAYPSQYPDLIRQRYKLDDQWFVKNLNINVREMLQCMLYLITHIPTLSETIQDSIQRLIICLQDIPEQLLRPMNIFIKYFATDLGNIEEFSLENILQFQNKPIIKIDNHHLLLPPPIILMQAVCESPLYWMIKDKNYADKAWQHRGEVTVDMVFQWIRSVFGVQNVFKNVLIKRNRQDITDIDILVLFQNKAIVFQIKSKKATLKTKLGDQKQFITDFSKSIQSAYNQGILSIEAIQNEDCEFFSGRKRIEIPSYINDYYIFCVTTEQFKTLNIRLKETLEINDSYSTVPVIVLSTFDLQILALYLQDPYDFLYYLHRRKKLDEAIIFSEEINILVAFLDFGLRNIPVDRVHFSNDFLDSINAHFRPWPTPKLIRDSYKWKREDKERIITLIKKWSYCSTNDLISYIYDYYEKLPTSVLQNLNHMNRDRIFQLLTKPQDLFSTLFSLSKKIGRNEKCPCGSGLKYKRCCGK